MIGSLCSTEARGVHLLRAGDQREGIREMGRKVLAVAAFAIVVPGSAFAATRLSYSTASNSIVQPQPPVGSCHAVGIGVYSRPDPRCTPGSLNPRVTQATIGRTVCRAGWTATVRPPEAVSEAEKRASMLTYGDTRPISDYEYDHFVPLELGGASNDPRNLWPEWGGAPNPKDNVENELRRAVCDHRMTLARAQQAIVANWVKLARHGIGVSLAPKPRPGPGPKPGPTPSAARCSASASWNSQYHDYDVYVHSNQPNQRATVTGAGYADVYFYASQSAVGDQINVQVGTASCSTSLSLH
jgi:hypothetical protein